MKDVRQQELSRWLSEQLSADIHQLIKMNDDAGFRRYFRFTHNNQSFIAVDAPEDKCNNRAFVDIASRLRNAGIVVPEILAYHQHDGFLLLSDLGEQMLSQSLNEQTMASYYHQAMQLLPTIAEIPCQNLPVYDQAFIAQELAIFSDWLLVHHLSISLNSEQQQQLEQCFDILIANALEQPQVFMHRDYHSRNLMLVADQVAVIDFQDAVHGPISYDLVSLLRDCYVKWPQAQVEPLLQYYVEHLSPREFAEKYPFTQWQRWFDLMGVQRHLKASGIFARLYHRDNKDGYLADIPLTLSYIVEVCAAYPELQFLQHLVSDLVQPRLLQLSQQGV